MVKLFSEKLAYLPLIAKSNNREYFNLLMIKSFLKVMLLITFFAKEGLDP